MSDTHDLSNQAGVEIDSEAIRRIREEKRLTQLYVSNVVGVTTDTVSRWENNRYPTIRKDNALKLAEALDVELERILKARDSIVDIAGNEADGDVKRSSLKKTIIIAGCLVVLVGAGVLFYLKLFLPVPITVLRYLPAYAAPGASVLIRVQVESEESMKVILKEEIPAGWQLEGSFPEASKVDNAHGVVRWIFKHSPRDKNIYYRLRVASVVEASGKVPVSGSLVANYSGRQSQIEIPSIGQLKIAPYHWADSDGNNIIDDMEILSVSDYAEEAGDELVGWDQLEQLWEAGHYRWDMNQEKFIPFKTE